MVRRQFRSRDRVQERMASFGHVAIGLAAGRAYARSGEHSLWRSMVAFSVVSLLPDADALAFPLGIPYEAPFGHRGATHSFACALLCGAIAWLAWGNEPDRLRTSVYTTLVMASHGILDAMTDGGRGIALGFPLTMHRYFLPWRPIPVAPIGRGLLTTHEGRHVLAFELVAFLPFVLWAFWPRRSLAVERLRGP